MEILMYAEPAIRMGHTDGGKYSSMIIQHLKEKVDAGASHLISQLFFDNSMFYSFQEKTKLAGINVPIEAGIMPVINKAQIERMVTLCGASLPEKFRCIMNKYENDKECFI